jgi:hypothetical protein
MRAQTTDHPRQKRQDKTPAYSYTHPHTHLISI